MYVPFSFFHASEADGGRPSGEFEKEKPSQQKRESVIKEVFDGRPCNLPRSFGMRKFTLLMMIGLSDQSRQTVYADLNDSRRSIHRCEGNCHNSSMRERERKKSKKK